MARALLEAATAQGVVRFDIDEAAASGPERVSRSGAVIAELDASLEAALGSIRPAAEAVIEAFRVMGPDEVSVEFGVRVDAEAGAVIAKAGAGVHFTVGLRWTEPTGG